MTILNWEEFNKEKQGFFNRHDNDFETFTSAMHEDGSYHKTYCFADNAQWNELMRPITEETEVEVRRAKVKVKVELLETEAWSTDDAHSIFTYEAW